MMKIKQRGRLFKVKHRDTSYDNVDGVYVCKVELDNEENILFVWMLGNKVWHVAVPHGGSSNRVRGFRSTWEFDDADHTYHTIQPVVERIIKGDKRDGEGVGYEESWYYLYRRVD